MHKIHKKFYPTHLQARKLCPQTYSLSLPLEWSQVTHIPASIKSGRAYKPEMSAFYNTFARQLCDDTCLPGWFSAFSVHSQTYARLSAQASFLSAFMISKTHIYKWPKAMRKTLLRSLAVCRNGGGRPGRKSHVGDVR